METHETSPPATPPIGTYGWGQPSPIAAAGMGPGLTNHARRRGNQRAITPGQIALVIAYGRTRYAGRAIYYYFGRRETRLYRHELGPLTSRLEGVTVVVVGLSVLTVFRNVLGPRDVFRR